MKKTFTILFVVFCFIAANAQIARENGSPLNLNQSNKITVKPSTRATGDTLMHFDGNAFFVNPTDAPGFAFLNEDIDGLTSHNAGWTAFMGFYSLDPLDFLHNDVDTAFMIGATSWFTPAGQADDWFEFGPLTIPASTGAAITYAVKWNPAWRDGYRILVSTTGMNNYIDFTNPPIYTLADLNPNPNDATDTIWSYRTINIPATYNGSLVYIAFHHNANDMDVLWLDEISVIEGTPTSPIASCSPLAWAAGNVPITTSVTSGTFTLSNVGVGTLTCSGITGLSAPFTTTLVPASVNLAASASTTFTFTYAPTVVGVNNETVVINTNGGNITIDLSGTGVACNTISSYPFTEGFEVNFPPDCWTLNDADGDGFNWVQETAPGFSAHGGTNVAASASWDPTAGPLTPDNYLITPQFNINNPSLTLKYWVAAQDPLYPAEHYSVMVSTTGTAPANFTEVFNETLTDSAWAERTVSLAAYNGNIYIAFRHHSVSDMFYMKIDDVSVDLITSISENSSNNSIGVYPNPAKEYVNITSNENISSVKVMNPLGQLTAYNIPNSKIYKMNTSNLKAGVYFIQIQTSKGTIIKKVNIIQ